MKHKFEYKKSEGDIEIPINDGEGTLILVDSKKDVGVDRKLIHCFIHVPIHFLGESEDEEDGIIEKDYYYYSDLLVGTELALSKELAEEAEILENGYPFNHFGVRLDKILQEPFEGLCAFAIQDDPDNIYFLKENWDWECDYDHLVIAAWDEFYEGLYIYDVAILTALSKLFK